MSDGAVSAGAMAERNCSQSETGRMMVDMDSAESEAPIAREPAAVPDAADQQLVAMRDGTRLATDVYLPQGSGPFPTIVTRMPYDKSHPENLSEFVAAAAMERRYAVVAQDTRGKVRSEGRFMPFEREALDGYDTLDWVTAQSWCNDDLALWGWSYMGYTSWAAVASGHPKVRAIAPLMTSTRFDPDWVWSQGIFHLGMLAMWCAATWADRNMYDWDLVLPWDIRPLADVLPAAFGGDRSRARVLDRLRSLGPNDPWWVEATFLGRNPTLGSSVAGMHHGGWWDKFTSGQIADWALASTTSGMPHHLVMDAMDHGLCEWSLDAESPASGEIPREQMVDFGEALMRAPLDLFDHVMRGRDNRLPAVSWKLTHDDWRTARTWPPAGSTVRLLYLDGDPSTDGGARLLDQRPSTASWLCWTHDPDDLVPGAGNDLYDLSLPPDDSLVEHRPDVLVFSTDPLQAELDLAGPLRAELRVGSSAPCMHVIVRLIDVFPDGRTRRIRDGAALVRAASDDRHVIVDLGHTGYRVGVDHRLRVHIASSEFPRYLPYFGDERDPWTATDGVSNQQRIRLGGGHGSRIALTTI